MVSASAALLFSQLRLGPAFLQDGPTDQLSYLPFIFVYFFFHLQRILFEIKIGPRLCAALIATEIQ